MSDGRLHRVRRLARRAGSGLVLVDDDVCRAHRPRRGGHVLPTILRMRAEYMRGRVQRPALLPRVPLRPERPAQITPTEETTRGGASPDVSSWFVDARPSEKQGR